MSKRNVKLLLLNNNQIILGTVVEDIGEEGVVILYDTVHLQADAAGKLGLALHDLNGMIKQRASINFERTALTAMIGQDEISEDILKNYLEWATGIKQPVKPQILLKG